MDKINPTGLKIGIDDVKSTTKDRFSFIFTWLLSSLGIVTMLGLLFKSVGLDFRLSILIPYTLGLVSIILLGKKTSKRILKYIPAMGVFFMTILFFREMTNGFFTLFNGYREAVSYTYLVYLLPYETSGNQVLVLQLLLGSLLAYGFTYLVERENFKAILGISILWIVIFIGIRIDFSMIFFGLWLGFMGLIKLRKNYGDQGSLKVISYLGILGIFGFSFLAGVSSFEGSQKLQENVMAIKQKMMTQLDEVKYGPKTNLPEGDFTNLKPYEPKEEEALEIIMEKPDSLYLKGFVGDFFENNQWEDSAKDQVFQEKDLFYYLGQEGFHGEAQMANLEEGLTGDITSHKMVIRNKTKRHKMIFTPYEMVYEEEANKLNLIADGSVEFLRAEKGDPYQFQVIPNGVKRYTTLAREFDLKRGEPTSSIEDYKNQESHYNEFVYKAYVELEPKDQEVLENLLGPYENNEEEHLPYFKVKEKILRSLYDQVYYNEAAEFSNDQGSFLQSFLETTQEGYAVHYATAATLMFRYYGIPARYVEGYLLTPDDVDGVLSNAMMTIDETHSHAWTEFYQDGVGWIPFETTPPYLNIMEKAEALDVVPKDSDHRPKKPPKEEDDLINDDSIRQGLSELILIKAQEILPYVGLSLLFLLLIYIFLKAIKVIKRRQDLKQELNLLRGETKKNQVIRLFSHLVKLLTHVKIIDNVNELYVRQGRILKAHENSSLIEEAFLITQKAKFSSIKITKEETDVVTMAYEKTLASIKEKSSLKERLNHRFGEVLYL